MKKRGFTLIELMVVIVIIGILAAIAIPKLFGMTAKAKASEVGPAAGTWSKMEQAYKMETNSVGSWASVGYKAPGYTGPTGGTTPNFTYLDETTDDQTALWKATSGKLSSDCNAKVWSSKFLVANDGPLTADNVAGCPDLTPNFTKLQ